MNHPKFKFISEQVSHHPPISALHAHTSDYETWTHSHVKSKFWGKSIEFTPLGSSHVRLTSLNEHYVFNRPMTTANNLIIGTLYLDVKGDSIIRNVTTGETCHLKYKERGWGNRNA